MENINWLIIYVVFSYIFNFVYIAYFFAKKDMFNGPPNEDVTFCFFGFLVSPITIFISVFIILVNIFQYFLTKRS